MSKRATTAIRARAASNIAHTNAIVAFDQFAPRYQRLH
jgi:hypothetical protein